MKNKKILATLLSITAMLFLSLLTTTQAQAQAQTFSGQANGLNSTTVVGGILTATTSLADTGPLPPAGGVLTNGVASANVTTIAGTTLTTGVIQTRTSGGALAGTPNSSQSQATVNNLALAIAGTTVTATTLQANSMCTCNGATPACSGSTVVENLVINTPGLATITLNGAVAPNTTFMATVGTVTTTIVVNEQIPSVNAITVNALRITVTDRLTDTTTNIIVAQASSDIVCAAAPSTPTPTPTTPGPTPPPTTPGPTPTPTTPGGTTTATAFSGDATGVIANANVLGTVTANARIAPTGALPTIGSAEIRGDLASGFIQLGALGTTNTLMTGILETRTSGGSAAGTPNSSQSRATVNNL
ncbi:MAG TPA: choice-of-anchor P family protein, partial [Bacteriovoracaceae bacterium]|nr:choice-of-anchor P family protein [Bacteriovoracaceae bacterium]